MRLTLFRKAYSIRYGAPEAVATNKHDDRSPHTFHPIRYGSKRTPGTDLGGLHCKANSFCRVLATPKCGNNVRSKDKHGSTHNASKDHDQGKSKRRTLEREDRSLSRGESRNGFQRIFYKDAMLHRSLPRSDTKSVVSTNSSLVPWYDVLQIEKSLQKST